MEEIKNYYYLVTSEDIIVNSSELNFLLEQLFLFVRFTTWDKQLLGSDRVFETNSLEVINYFEDTEKFVVKISFMGQTDLSFKFPGTESEIEISSKDRINHIVRKEIQANSIFAKLRTPQEMIPSYTVEVLKSNTQIVNFLNFKKLNDFNPSEFF